MNVQFSHSHSLLWVVLWQGRCSATHSFCPPQEPIAQILTKVFPVSSVLVIHSYDNSFLCGLPQSTLDWAFQLNVWYLAYISTYNTWQTQEWCWTTHLQGEKSLVLGSTSVLDPWGPSDHCFLFLLLEFPILSLPHLTPFNNHLQEATSSLSDIKESLHHFKPHIPNRPQITQVQVDYAIFWKHWIVLVWGRTHTRWPAAKWGLQVFLLSSYSTSLWLANEKQQTHH